MKTRFDNFLRKHNVYNSFYNQVLNPFLFFAVEPKNYFYAAFTWDFTREGRDKWKELNELWLKEI